MCVQAMCRFIESGPNQVKQRHWEVMRVEQIQKRNLNHLGHYPKGVTPLDRIPGSLRTRGAICPLSNLSPILLKYA